MSSSPVLLIDAMPPSGPVQAAIRSVVDRRLDDLPAYPLQTELFETYHALSSVRLFLLTTHLAEATVERIKSALN